MIAASLFKRMVVAVVGVLAVLVVALAGLGAANLVGLSPFGSSQTDRSHPALLKSINDISQYHAAEANFELVVDDGDEEGVEWLPDVISGRRTLFVAAGTVNAYVDLSDLADGDLKLSADGTSVTVTLPEAQLDEPNLDHERSYVFSQDRGVLDRITDAIEPAQQSQFYQLAETKLTAAAEESELRQRASENTKAMLTGMFGSLGISATFVDVSQ
ncbi:DUF4230 domain-containing protein [Mycetocola zhadangensis]|uniref:DUF4230 domain-containing protein n=1 Tax=Mycetocola zhadangensis TaxID=1164595 RepID=UPI0019B6F61E|nr:DUF4230 domain-containing protein [Mycetocola zhadangensis]GGE95113.1 hypothetical protein GCM10011313_17610 [Mycetocola zhadangensis]